MSIEESKEKRLAEGHCCWHCKHYLRPTGVTMIDGPVEYVCSVDRDTSYYAIGNELNPGEKLTRPDYFCEKFEMDPPPGPDRSLGLDEQG